jgi:hypothetical protein
MPRLGKKTLYLDLDALERLQDALKRFPGRPSLSSFFNEWLPKMADTMTEMADAAERGGLRGIADMLQITTREVVSIEDDVRKGVQEAKNPDEPIIAVQDVPPKKPRKTRSKKVVGE